MASKKNQDPANESGAAVQEGFPMPPDGTENGQDQAWGEAGDESESEAEAQAPAAEEAPARTPPRAGRGRFRSTKSPKAPRGRAAPAPSQAPTGSPDVTVRIRPPQDRSQRGPAAPEARDSLSVKDFLGSSNDPDSLKGMIVVERVEITPGSPGVSPTDVGVCGNIADDPFGWTDSIFSRWGGGRYKLQGVGKDGEPWVRWVRVPGESLVIKPAADNEDQKQPTRPWNSQWPGQQAWQPQWPGQQWLGQPYPYPVQQQPAYSPYSAIPTPWQTQQAANEADPQVAALDKKLDAFATALLERKRQDDVAAQVKAAVEAVSAPLMAEIKALRESAQAGPRVDPMASYVDLIKANTAADANKLAREKADSDARAVVEAARIKAEADVKAAQIRADADNARADRAALAASAAVESANARAFAKEQIDSTRAMFDTILKSKEKSSDEFSMIKKVTDAATAFGWSPGGAANSEVMEKAQAMQMNMQTAANLVKDTVPAVLAGVKETIDAFRKPQPNQNQDKPRRQGQGAQGSQQGQQQRGPQPMPKLRQLPGPIKKLNPGSVNKPAQIQATQVPAAQILAPAGTDESLTETVSTGEPRDASLEEWGEIMEFVVSRGFLKKNDPEVTASALVGWLEGHFEDSTLTTGVMSILSRESVTSIGIKLSGGRAIAKARGNADAEARIGYFLDECLALPDGKAWVSAFLGAIRGEPVQEPELHEAPQEDHQNNSEVSQ